MYVNNTPDLVNIIIIIYLTNFNKNIHVMIDYES